MLTTGKIRINDLHFQVGCLNAYILQKKKKKKENEFRLYLKVNIYLYVNIFFVKKKKNSIGI